MKHLAPLLSALLLAALPAVHAANPGSPKTEKFVIGAGCFWCMEALYEEQPGVVAVVSGYAGGETENPTYKQVCTGRTGHAEVIEIEFDPAKTSYAQLLKVFWASHDPTNGKGVWPDFGTQYRSIILYADEAQKEAAEKSKAAEEKKLGKKIATQIVPLVKFYPAEDYHQDYVKKNPNDSYVKKISLPRIQETEAKLKTEQ